MVPCSFAVQNYPARDAKPPLYPAKGCVAVWTSCSACRWPVIKLNSITSRMPGGNSKWCRMTCPSLTGFSITCYLTNRVDDYVVCCSKNCCILPVLGHPAIVAELRLHLATDYSSLNAC
eukprot:GHRR01026060.1.p1 GENE.GHRR01026060.1~~GHRR01026060.1.p1  ORF type:complete len:119 (-),score=6.00 GHRR01026060.1:1176-1532(-)